MRCLSWLGLGRWVVSLTLVALLGLAGCTGSSNTGTVKGKVTYKGQPLKGGTVSFQVGEKYAPQPAEIQEDGTYVAENVPLGTAKVAVETESLKPPSGMQGKYPPPAPPNPKVKSEEYKPPDPAERAKRYVRIPDKYMNPDTSGLSTPVKSGTNTYDIDIADK
jgi:hypothetical protein